MKKGFYCKLALSNIRKNAKTYIPYILTCIGCVMTFYIILAMSLDPQLQTISGGTVTAGYLYAGVTIIAIFSLIFLFYTNSFLMKRRKKEFGIYHVLGMGKRHIMKCVSLETLFVSGIGIVAGIAFGVVFARLMMLLMLRLLAIEAVFSMTFSPTAAVVTTFVFGCIFLLNLLANMIKIGRNKTIELLYGGKKGEREPKTNIPLALLGFLALAGGYFLAQYVSDPASALTFFFVAVLLVIIGTYALITAGSTVILKAMKKKKNYYYSSKHFISVSGMLYRMKQNAAGISSICILSTMVLVTITTTGCLYFGIDSIVADRVDRDVCYESYHEPKEKTDTYIDFLERAEEKTGCTVSDALHYRYLPKFLYKTENGFSTTVDGNEYFETCFLTAEEYNRGLSEKIALGENEILMFQDDHEEVGLQKILGKEFTAVPEKSRERMREIYNFFSFDAQPTCIMVVKDSETLQEIFPDEDENWRFAWGVNTQNPQKVADVFNKEFNKNKETSFDAFTRADKVLELRNFYGSFLFLGIFLGSLFLMATVLIMYYKQISEGYEDKERFGILEKVGMSHKEIRRTIHSQVLMVFFIPIVFAVIHMSFAFNMIRIILTAFGLSDMGMLLLHTSCSVAGFAVLYLIAYVFTARTYYKIVK